ncbi:hypothetical protein ACFWJV_24975 [Streptomyces rochei]|uniref:hypothetical protein n=1 Tax=Streptomyces TaxID=1883 RepID=UPI0027DD94C2|nr:hypothetical protein [Streptomyces rochei]WMI61835.1 hypothetical protein RBH85_06495 [Streptomyces rochei]
MAAYKKKGIDVTAVTPPVAHRTPFSFPVTNFAADVPALMRPAMRDVYRGAAPVSSLDEADDQINFRFSQ